MKGRYDLFGLITVIGMAAILIAAAVSILVKNSHLGNKLAFLGAWVIVSFFVMVGIEGSVRSIPRVDIKVPWKLAIFSFVLAGILFVAGFMFGVK